MWPVIISEYRLLAFLLKRIEGKVFPIHDKRYPKNRRLGGPQTWNGRFRKEKILTSRPARRIVITEVTLSSSNRGSL